MQKKSYRKLYNFWIGPLVAGGCLATGYEATHRFMILRSTWQAPEVQLLTNQRIFPEKNLDSNSDETIQSLQNAKNTQLNNPQEKYQENLAQLQDNEMQKLLHALKISLKDPQRQKKVSQNKNLNLSDTKTLLKETTFDELFRTLPRQ